MIRKIRLSICVIIFSVCGLFVPNSQAFIPIPNPSIPFAITFDAINTAIYSLQNIGILGIGKEVTNIKRVLGSINSIKGLGDIFTKGVCFLNCDAAKSSDNNKAVKGAKDIQESEFFDIYDQASVKKAFYDNFIVLKTDGLDDEACFRNLGHKFYRDNVIQAIASTETLQKEFKESKEKFASFKVALQEGQTAGQTDGETAEIEKADNTNTALENKYLALQIEDELMRIYQEYVAMHYGYEMALAIHTNKTAPIRTKEADIVKEQSKTPQGQNMTFIFNEGKKFAQTSNLAFAQQSNSSDDDFSYLMRKVSAPKAEGISAPFAGQEANLAALREITDIGEEVIGTTEIHNVIATLPSYRDVFIEYHKAVKNHNYFLNLLKASDQCAITYLNNYYTDPEKVWSGGDLGALVNQHEYRKGVSKWLIDTYDVAKAQMVMPAGPEDVDPHMMDANEVDMRDLSSINKDESESQEGYRNPVKEKENYDLSRVITNLPWTISAEISRDLGEDQQKDSKWGTLRSAFPLWKDQKNFYNQYIDGKYDNIVQYLERIDLRPSEIQIAREYNKLNKDKIISSFEQSAKTNVRNWLEDLTGFQDSISLDGILANILVPESQWIAPVKQKLEGMSLNHVNLNEREVVLKNRKAVLTKRKNEILAMTALSAVYKRELDEINKELAAIEIELKDIAENRTWLNSFAYDLDGVVKTEGWTVATNTELIVAQAKEFEVAQSLEKEFTDALQSYDEIVNKVIKERKNEIDGYNTRLKTISAQIEAIKSKIHIYADTVNRAENSAIAVQQKIISHDDSTVNKADLRNKADDQAKQIKNLAKEADTLIEKIDVRNKYYDGRLADAERELSIKQRALLERQPNYDDMAPLSYLYSNKVARTISGADSSYAGALAGYLKSAFAIAEEFRPYTVEIAERKRAKIFDLGDNLYEIKGVPNVTKIHQELIDELKGISIEELLSFSKVLKTTYSSPVAMMEIVRSLYNKYMIENICPENVCSTNDNQYFVSLFAKNRDFQVPKEPINEYLPPLREVVFFDEADYSNLYSKDKRIKVVDNPGTSVGGITIGHSYHYEYYVSKHGILNYGGRVPEIWKLALGGKAFIERDIDLEKFFGKDEDAITKTNRYRGGRYPCNLNGQVIDVDKNANFIKGTGSTNGLQLCQEVEFKNTGLYSSIVSKGSGETAHIGVGQSAPRDYESELGQMFSWKDDYVVFREDVQKTFDRLIEIAEYQQEDKKYNSSTKDDIYDISVFKKNQFGDFLNFVTQEITYRQTRDKMKVAVDETKEALFKKLRKAGYEPKEDLDLAIDEDYNTVKKVLKGKKTKFMNDIAPKIRAVRTNTNAVVQQRIEDFDKVYKALELDSEELVIIPASNVDLSKLSETIKSTKANSKVMDEYSKEADAALEKALKKIGVPYCASY